MEQQNEQTARVMIAERADEIRRKKRMVSDLVETANELAGLYAGLNLGAFTVEALNDAFCNSGQGIKRRYIEQAETDAKALPISSLRDEVISKAKEFKNPFSVRIASLNRCTTTLDRELLRYLSVTDSGEVVFTAETEKALEEDTHEYLTDPREIEKFMIHQSIVRLLNEFFDNGDGLPLMWFQLFPLDGNGVFVMPENGANYSGMLEQVARKRGEFKPESLNPYESTATSETPEREAKKQQNRQRGGTVAGVAKKPDYIDRGAELRAKNNG